MIDEERLKKIKENYEFLCELSNEQLIMVVLSEIIHGLHGLMPESKRVALHAALRTKAGIKDEVWPSVEY